MLVAYYIAKNIQHISVHIIISFFGIDTNQNSVNVAKTLLEEFRRRH